MLSKEQFKDVFEAHYDAIRTYVFYRCGNTETAEDIAQDVFMRVWDKRMQLNANEIKPLLYTIAQALQIDDYRKQQRRMEFEQYMQSDEPLSETPEDSMSFEETKHAYAEALEAMTESQRAVFLLSREDGMTYPQIAEHLNISIKTVEKHITAALKRLKTKLSFR